MLRTKVLLIVALSTPAVLGLQSVALAITSEEAFDGVWATTDQAVAERLRELFVVLGAFGSDSAL